MQATLFVPAPFDAIAGGPIYNRAIVAGLRDAGHAVDVVELSGRHPLPDAVARGSALTAWRALAPGALALIEGECLPAFAGLADELAARGAVGLIHHPTALEIGRDDRARAELRGIEMRLFPVLRRIVVTSDDTAQRLHEFGVAAGRVAVVTPGMPQVPRSTGPALAGCRILSIGNLLPRKGHDVLLRALARLRDLDWTLTIVGGAHDAPYAAMLPALAAELAIGERVSFAGAVPPAALEPLWAACGLFALATHYEGYGMAAAEALRRGLPVAVTAGGAQAGVVPASAGVIAAPGDHDALSKAMRRIIYDRAVRLAMADAAWQAGAALPDWATQVRRFAAALEL